MSMDGLMDHLCQRSTQPKDFIQTILTIVVLNTVYKDAIINREKMLSILKGPKFEQILQKAQANWNEFTPTKENVITAGIDSSFNNTKFQGIELWATTAVSIKTDGDSSCGFTRFRIRFRYRSFKNCK